MFSRIPRGVMRCVTQNHIQVVRHCHFRVGRVRDTVKRQVDDVSLGIAHATRPARLPWG